MTAQEPNGKGDNDKRKESPPFSFNATSPFQFGGGGDDDDDGPLSSTGLPVVGFGNAAPTPSHSFFSSFSPGSQTSFTPTRRPHTHRVGGYGSIGRSSNRVNKKKPQPSSSGSSSFLFLPTTATDGSLGFSEKGETRPKAESSSQKIMTKTTATSFTSIGHKTDLSLEARQSPLYQALSRVVHRASTFQKEDQNDMKKMTSLAERYCTEASSMSLQILCHFLFACDGTSHPRDVAAGRDHNGQTPLHICVHQRADVEAIHLLLEIYPEAADQTDKRNAVPLQVAFPAEEKLARKTGMALGSYLVGNSLQLKVVQALLQAHRDNGKVRASKSTPFKVSLLSIREASNLDPFDGDDNGEDDYDDENPDFALETWLLHLAVSNSPMCEAGVLDAILEANPDSALELDDVGRTPLHLLLMPTSPLLPCTELGLSSNRHSVILTLLGRNAARKIISPREVASIQDAMGRTPLHVACHHGVEDVEVLQGLLDAYPEALVTRDKSGQTPLHAVFTGLAASHRISQPETYYSAISLSVISQLLRAHPQAAMMKIGNLQQTALHLAAIHGAHCQEGVFEVVLRAHPAALFQQDSSGRMPLHLLLASLSSPKFGDCTTPSESEQSRSVPQQVIGLVRRLLVRPKEDPTARVSLSSLDQLPDPVAIAAAKDASGSTALHIASFHGAPYEELIQLLLEVYPEAANHVDNSGNLPIHLALSCVSMTSRTILSSTTNVIRLLMRGKPLAEVKKGVATPLHLAASHASHLQVEVFDMLHRANPSLVLHPDGDGQTPLHCLFAAASSQGDKKEKQDKERFLQQMSVLLQEVETTVNTSADAPGTPSTTTTEGTSRGEDTRDAKASMPPMVTITAAAAKNKRGSTPLHVAVSVLEHCDVDILETLLHACPAAASSRDGEGRYPLHAMALFSGGRLQLAPFERLVKAYPPAILETDNSGATLLHLLLQKPCSSDLFEFLLKAAPEAATKCDKSGWTPLHVALSKWPGTEEDYGYGDSYNGYEKKNDLDLVSLCHVVSRIIEVCPHAIRVRSDAKIREARSPLHIAIEKNREENIIEQLIRADSDAAAEQWERERATPLAVSICRFHNNESICRLILTQCPQSARTLVMGDNTVLHLIRRLDVLEDLLEAWPEALFQRCGRQGWTPLHSWMSSEAFCNHEFTVLGGLLGALTIVKAWNREKFIRALQMTDYRGLTPFHHALARLADDEDDLDVTHNVICRSLERADFKMVLQSFPSVLFMRVEPTREVNNENDNSDEGRMVNLELTSIIGKICEMSTAAELLRILFHEFSDFSLDGEEVNEQNEKPEEEEEEDHDPSAMWFIRKACENSDGYGSLALVRFCHNRYPACVRKPSKVGGDLALHIACRQSSCTLEMVQLLTALYGAALTMRNGGGQVPFEIACWNDAPLNATFHLLRSAPDVILR